MTSFEAIRVVAIVLCVALSAWRIERFFTERRIDRHAIDLQKLADDRDARTRELALREREVAVTERKSPVVELPPPTEIPSDIIAMAMSESEDWAREDAVRLIAEAYVESNGDWDRAGTYLAHRYAAAPPSRMPSTAPAFQPTS